VKSFAKKCKNNRGAETGNLKYGLFILAYLCSIIYPLNILAQSECHTALGAHLKPIKSTGVSWATEGMFTQGKMTDRDYTQVMFLTGLNLTSKDFKHQLYTEGAFKYWWNTKTGAVEGQGGSGEHFTSFSPPKKKHVGIREMFYQYKTSKSTLKLGIQSFNSSDFFMVNERLLGANYSFTSGGVSVNSMLATSHRDFAKMQNVCGTRHVYRIIRGGKVDFVGNRLFESNLFLTSVTYTPANKISSGNTDSPESIDEFESFNTFDEFESSENIKTTKDILKTIGLIYYQEFGTVFHTNKNYAGAFAELNLPFDVNFKAEGVYQIINQEDVWLAYANLSRLFLLSNSSVKLNAGYFHKFKSETPFYPSFSNLFLGEIIRLDSKEIPLGFANIKYKFQHKLKPFVGIGGAWQFTGNYSREIDITIGSHIIKSLRAYAVFSRVQSSSLDKDYYMGKIEVRITI